MKTKKDIDSISFTHLERLDLRIKQLNYDNLTEEEQELVFNLTALERADEIYYYVAALDALGYELDTNKIAKVFNESVEFVEEIIIEICGED